MQRVAWVCQRQLIFVVLVIHCVSKNVPHLTCYDLDTQDPIATIFWQKCYWESKKSDNALLSHLTYLVLQHYLAKEKTQETVAGALCMQNSPTAAALSTSFHQNHTCSLPPKKRLKLKALITRFRESYGSVSMSRGSIGWRNQAATGWILAMHYTANAIFVFPILPGNAKIHVTWGGIVKRLLIAYSISSISVKNIKISSRVKVIASQTWDVFWDTA